MSMFSNQFQNEPDRFELGRDQSAELDRADHDRDRDRQAGDREVVEDLADRLGERPAVGEVHERAVDRVHQRHPGGEQDRQAQDRVPRQPGARRRRRRARAARPRSRCRTRARTARRSGTSATAWSTVLVSLPRKRFISPRLSSCSSSCCLVVASGPHLAEHLDDPEQDHDVDRRDHVQKACPTRACRSSP